MTRERLARVALLAVPFAALAFSPRLTMEQFELPKHAALLALGAVLLAAGGTGRLRDHPPLLGWLAAVLLASAAAAAPVAAWLGEYENLEGALTWGLYAVLFLAGAALGRREAAGFRAAVVAAALLGSGYALLQLAGADPVPGERFRHVRSFAGNPDFLAQQMAIAIPLVVAGGAAGVLALGAVGVLALVLALTASRGGLVGAIAGMCALWFLNRGRVAPRTALLPAAVFAASVVAAEFMLPPDLSLSGRAGALSGQGGFARSRGMMWEGAARAARERPLAGWGPDGLGPVFLRTAPPGWADIEGLGTTARKAHAEPLHLLVVCGAAGLGAWLWLIVAAGRGRERDAGAAAAVAAALAHNLVGFSTAATAPVVWVLLGRLSSRVPASAPPAYSVAARRVVPASIGILAAVLGAIRFHADARAYPGNEASRAGARERVAAPFLAAARLAPWEPVYPVRAGIALEQSGRTVDALPLFDRAVALSPLDGIRLGHAGRAAFALASDTGDADARAAAYAVLLRSVELAPSQPSVAGAAVMAAQAMGDRARAGELVAAMRERSPVWAARLLGR